MSSTSFDIGECGLCLLTHIHIACHEACSGVVSTAVDHKLLLAYVHQVIEYGKLVHAAYVKAAISAAKNVQTTELELYPILTYILDSYGYLEFDLAEYNEKGGGARLVLYKRSIISFYVSLIQLHDHITKKY
jgi:hypothetical protein